MSTDDKPIYYSMRPVSLEEFKAQYAGAPTDQELLELAAKAARYTVRYVSDGNGGGNFYMEPSQLWWNPLIDDGDALRLAVELQFDLSLGGTDVFVRKDGLCLAQQSSRPNRSCSTRRAIVRAAAEIGKAMP
jgi:hypothetical protein